MSEFRIDGPWGFAAVPPLARVEVRRLRRALASRATGAVLDLGGTEVSVALYAGVDAVGTVTVVSSVRSERLRLRREADRLGVDLRLEPRVPVGGRFDTVVGVARMVTAQDPQVLAGQLRRAVAPGGTYLGAEPAPSVGAAGRVQRAGAPVARELLGVDPDLDLPPLLRAAGWNVVEVHRDRVSWLAAPLRTVVRVVARPAAERTDVTSTTRTT